MSEPLRIALVAEGPTDRVVIEAALTAVLGARVFILNLLHPEPTRSAMGGGWCGVLKWCREFASRGFPSIEDDPTLPGFDLFIVHLDADVAGMRYEAGGAAVVEAAQGLLPLPCEEPCPPVSASVQALRARLHSWLGVQQVGARTVLCVPSKMTEAWLAAAVLPEQHRLLSGIECNANLAAHLETLPTKEKIKKKPLEYMKRAGELTRQWERVTQTCTQAAQFAAEVSAAVDAKAAIIPPEPVAPVMTGALRLTTTEPLPKVADSVEGSKPVALEVALELMLAAEAAAPMGNQLAEQTASTEESPSRRQLDDPSTN
jgi:hypothetical protein